MIYLLILCGGVDLGDVIYEIKKVVREFFNLFLLFY